MSIETRPQEFFSKGESFALDQVERAYVTHVDFAQSCTDFFKHYPSTAGAAAIVYVIPFLGFDAQILHHLVAKEIVSGGVSARDNLARDLVKVANVVMLEGQTGEASSGGSHFFLALYLMNRAEWGNQSLSEALDDQVFPVMKIIEHNPPISAHGFFAPSMIVGGCLLPRFVYYYYAGGGSFEPGKSQKALVAIDQAWAESMKVSGIRLQSLDPLQFSERSDCRLALKLATTDLLDRQLVWHQMEDFFKTAGLLFLSEWRLNPKEYFKTGYNFVLPLVRQMQQLLRWLEVSLYDDPGAEVFKERLNCWRRPLDLVIEAWGRQFINGIKQTRFSSDLRGPLFKEFLEIYIALGNIGPQPPPAEVPEETISVEQAERIFAWVQQVLDQNNWYPRPEEKSGGPLFVILPPGDYSSVPAITVDDLVISQLDRRVYFPHWAVLTPEQVGLCFSIINYQELADWSLKAQVFQKIVDLIEQAGIKNTGVVVDVGMNEGWWARFWPGSIIGCDVSEGALARFRQATEFPDGSKFDNKDRIRAYLANALEPWCFVANDEADAVVISFVEQWLRHGLEDWLGEAFRVLRGDGVLLMNLYRPETKEIHRLLEALKRAGFNQIKIFKETIGLQTLETDHIDYKETFVRAVKP
ncbi:class I SAM-dependent methyltransferase [Patescibacteria group bacterium]|nr:class I SAM-dependent methyltransferase [Patescibacteria group bacterium]